MRSSGRVLLGVLVVVGLACGEESAPPVPTAMVLAGGNNQSALPGITLALPLRVTLTGAGGSPFSGARVTWSVTTGSASLGSPIDTSDVNGESSTTVTVGVVPGNLVVTATVTGVPAVNFTLTALDPCNVRVTLNTDTTATGVLTNFDCQFNGPFFTDFYGVSLPAQAGLLITMSATYDAYLEQYHLTGPFAAVSDDTDSSNTNPRLAIIAATGNWVLAASTFAGNVTGPYTLTVAPGTETLTGCRGDDRFLKWITRGVAITDQVQATDCQMGRASGGVAYSDRVLITLTPTRGISVNLASAAFNPRIELYLEGATGPALAAFADGVGGSATLNHTPAAAAVYRLDLTTVDTAATGAYTVTLDGPVPGEANVAVLPVSSLPWRAADVPARATRGKARSN